LGILLLLPLALPLAHCSLVWPSPHHSYHLWRLSLLARTEVEPYQVIEIALTSHLGQNVTPESPLGPSSLTSGTPPPTVTPALATGLVLSQPPPQMVPSASMPSGRMGANVDQLTTQYQTSLSLHSATPATMSQFWVDINQLSEISTHTTSSTRPSSHRRSLPRAAFPALPPDPSPSHAASDHTGTEPVKATAPSAPVKRTTRARRVKPTNQTNTVG
jgi:hypothetical protein